jgi:zinc protease
MLGLPLDERVRAARIYVKLDAKDVQTAFAKWLRPGDLVEVTQGPVPKYFSSETPPTGCH